MLNHPYFHTNHDFSNNHIKILSFSRQNIKKKEKRGKWIPVRSGRSKQECLKRERTQVFLGRRRYWRNDTQREAVSEKWKLLNSKGFAGSSSIQRKRLTWNWLGRAIQRLWRGDALIPKCRVYCRFQVRHFWLNFSAWVLGVWGLGFCLIWAVFVAFWDDEST